MPQPKPVVQVPRVWDMTASDSRDDADTRREHREIQRMNETPCKGRKHYIARLNRLRSRV
jgi:hypothetical protein